VLGQNRRGCRRILILWLVEKIIRESTEERDCIEKKRNTYVRRAQWVAAKAVKVRRNEG
jgi:hypothetical protein